MRSSILFSIPLLLCASVTVAFGADTYTQQPEIQSVTAAEAPSENDPKAEAKPGTGSDLLKGGPKPSWIWGANPDGKYTLTKTFSAAAPKTAWVQATCDNVMKVSINGQLVGESSQWEVPVQKDVTKLLMDGDNEITAEVQNAGGASGFALKLVIKSGDGKDTFIVSDGSWQAAETSKPKDSVAVNELAKMGAAPWNNVFDKPAVDVAQRDTFQALPGFQIEKLFTVPKSELGSWVSIAFDNKGRLLASDQGGQGICRITPPAIGSKEETKVEKLDLKMTSAQGMLYAFDSLYFSVNGGPGSGFYRARDTNNDDQFDEVVKLKGLAGGGEHGPHALRLSPDGKSIYLIAGNHTDPPADFDASRLPSNWSEDLLLPRQWDARGHARGKLAPGGWIAKTDPDGKTWEIFSSGYRNPYDMDFNADGELFAYDADMEWDMGMPWYRPTRVVHATSGSEFGWRSGTGKWPAYYADSLPELVDIGPGSPVGATFGYGAKFPAKYQKAFYILDWTFGTMYAIHIEPDGASYKATKEEFLSRTPLPLTDAAVGPDGALYFTVGGRGTQSELYRVTYVGDASTAAVDAKNEAGKELRDLRHKLESFHHAGNVSEEELAMIWSNLKHSDRFIRYAARVALENRPTDSWREMFRKESDGSTLIYAAIALARQGEPADQALILEKLGSVDFDSLEKQQQLALLRAYSLTFIRQGEPAAEVAEAVAKRFDAKYPTSDDQLNAEMVQLLVYLQSDTVVPKTIALMKKVTTPSPDDISELLARNRGYGGTIAEMIANMPDLKKMHLAFVLRNAKQGWTVPDSTYYFRWLQDARSKKGGASYQGFITNMENDAFANASDIQRLAVEAAGLRKPAPLKELPKPQGPGHDWKLDEVITLAESGLKGRDFANGQRAFAAARCVVCHRFGGEGGATGPDLTQAAGRFVLKDLAEAIIKPDAVISDQYRAHKLATLDGKVYTGRIASEDAKQIIILTDPEDSTKVVEVAREDIDAMSESKTSLMPADLLKPLNEDEVLDLLAYLLSRGNAKDAMFSK